MTYSTIGRGADGLLYFRWRTCRFGADQHWSGVLEADNFPRRRYDGVRRVGQELRKAGPAILGTSVVIDVAIAMTAFEPREPTRISWVCPRVRAPGRRCTASFGGADTSWGGIHWIA